MIRWIKNSLQLSYFCAFIHSRMPLTKSKKNKLLATKFVQKSTYIYIIYINELLNENNPVLYAYLKIRKSKIYKIRMRGWCWTHCIWNTVEGRYWATFSEPDMHNRITSGQAEKREHWYPVVSTKNKRFFLFHILYAFLSYKRLNIYTTKHSQLSCARHYVHTWPSTFYYKSILYIR